MKEITLHHGDMLAILPTLPEKSVDAIITDPPYHLTTQKQTCYRNTTDLDTPHRRTQKGFMGKHWDGGDIAFDPETWRQVLRVLKPGGFMACFGGTRTVHRMACAIEDAGFEIRDQLLYCFGCLSDDTQIVTRNGAVPYTSIKPNDEVLCYDISIGAYSFQPVEKIVEYDIEDTAYRVQSDHTDQIVSRNHRCIVERGGREVFAYAETCERQESVPVLEDLPALLAAISQSDEGTSGSQQVLQAMSLEGDVRSTQRHWQTSVAAQGHEPVHLHGVREAVLSLQEIDARCEADHMQQTMQWKTSDQANPEGNAKSGTRQVDPTIPCLLSAENDRTQQSSVERRGDLQAAAWQSQRGEVRALPDGIHGDGSEGWLRDGTSVDYGDTDRTLANAHGSGASHQSRSSGQQNRELDAVRNQHGPQEIRAWSGHRTTVASVTPFAYRGKIWCVKVPTGAFVAVRNGKAFVTGNSGFPKATNASKMIDKHLGAERKVVGKKQFRQPRTGVTKAKGYGGVEGGFAMAEECDVTEPATDLAKRWEGWHSALKPAYEPIILARRPFEGNTAENLIAYGVGSLNIDASRVPTHGERVRASVSGGVPFGNNYEIGTGRIYGEQKGRFPANILHDGSDEVLEAFARFGEKKTGDLKPYLSSNRGGLFEGGWSNYRETVHKGDSGTAARFFNALPYSEDELRMFYCAKANKKDRAGSRHPTVKPQSLMRWLCRLITPPGGTILDCFAGSGSTGEAAYREGFHSILIEREDEYIADIQRRIDYLENELIVIP